METIVEKAKARFIEMIESFGSDPYRLLPHVPEAEKWARFMLKKYPQANEEILMLAVWLHDIGHYPLPTDVDHAVRGEQRAREFLEHENYEKDKINEVLHCVRSHRCRDILPKTLEATIMAFVDSASHMTDSMYFDIAKGDKDNGVDFRVYAKMERDMRDLSSFPEVQSELAGLFNAWQNLIREYEKIKLA